MNFVSVRELRSRSAAVWRALDEESQIAIKGVRVAPKPLASRLPDAGDQPILEVAVAAGVEFLVTGNLKRYPLCRREGVRVVSPREFLDAELA